MPTSQMFQAEVTLTDAQIKALPTTPIDIVPSPGLNKALVFLAAILQISSQGTYTNIDSTYAQLNFRAGSGGAGQNCSAFLVNDSSLPSPVSALTNFLLSTSNKHCAHLPPFHVPVNTYAPYAQDLGNVEDSAISLVCDNSGAGDFTGGDASNTLKVVVFYVVVDV